MSDLIVSYPTRLSNFSKLDIQELREMEWSPNDRNLMGIGGLPTHLQSKVYIISTHGRRDFVDQKDVIIPGNSIIKLYNADGVIEMGWNRLVKPTGHFVDNNQVYRPANEKFTRPDFNKFCMLVSTPKIIFYNQQEGASVGSIHDYWRVAVNDGGQCKVAFNDEDNNNRGTFTQYLEIIEGRVFADWISNSVQ